MKAILGEIIIARYAQRVHDGKWQIEAPAAVINDVLRRNLYSTEIEAREAIKKLVPLHCRAFIRFFV